MQCRGMHAGPPDLRQLRGLVVQMMQLDITITFKGDTNDKIPN